MAELKFRDLTPQEIEVKVGYADNNGVGLMLYKDARCDQRILDETVGTLNWQKRYSRNNMNCVVSIWDDSKSQWVEKEDTGVASETASEKGLASDSFKRACFAWGIGRALYSVKALGIKFTAEELGKAYENGKVFGSFRVLDIDYANDVIARIKIGFFQGNSLKISKEFNLDGPTNIKFAASTQPTRPAESNTPAQASGNNSFGDQEVLLIGGCRGKKFGDVKDSNDFLGFLRWVKGVQNGHYGSDVQKNDQLKRAKELAEKRGV